MVQIVLEFEILQFHMKKIYKFDLYTNTRKCCLSKIRVGELRIAEILQTDGRTDGDQVFEQRRKNLITLKDQTTKMYQSSREICLRKSGVRCA
jgi:hypothetical protein